jgi:O-antigen/teichoic acid export membrane protein
MKLSELSASLSLRNRFNVEVAWNLASFGVLAISGVILNVVIVRAHGRDALGVFNQVWAFYVVFSQVAVLGVHFSALKHVSHHQGDRGTCAEIATAATVLVGLLGIAVGACAYGARGVAASLWESPGVGTGLALAAPGLVFFALNKVLLNVLNGLRYMRAYAAFQAARYVLIMGGVGAITLLRQPESYLAGSLTIAEFTLFVLLALYVHFGVVPFSFSKRFWSWLREHVRFGLRGFLSGALAGINTRVDVLMLGFVCSDTVVGVYSFAAMIAEGFSLIAISLRRVVDPILGMRFALNETEQISGYAVRIRRVFHPLMAVVALVAIVGYPLGLRLVVPAHGLGASWLVFAILMVGIWVNAGYRPFLGILLQGGRPGTHTILIVILVGSNAVLNAALIPLLEAYGAAIATGLVYALEAVLIAGFARRVFNIRL